MTNQCHCRACVGDHAGYGACTLGAPGRLAEGETPDRAPEEEGLRQPTYGPPTVGMMTRLVSALTTLVKLRVAGATPEDARSDWAAC